MYLIYCCNSKFSFITFVSCCGLSTCQLIINHVFLMIYYVRSFLFPCFRFLCVCEFVLGDIVKASKWLLCIYKSMDEFRANDDILASLRCLPMIPLTNGEIVSLDLQTVFFPLSTLEKDVTRKSQLLFALALFL